jgi:hypothetical protein
MKFVGENDCTYASPFQLILLEYVSFLSFLASHISFVGMATLVKFLILHRKVNMVGCYIIQKEMEF